MRAKAKEQPLPLFLSLDPQTNKQRKRKEPRTAPRACLTPTLVHRLIDCTSIVVSPPQEQYHSPKETSNQLPLPRPSSSSSKKKCRLLLHLRTTRTSKKMTPSTLPTKEDHLSMMTSKCLNDRRQRPRPLTATPFSSSGLSRRTATLPMALLLTTPTPSSHSPKTTELELSLSTVDSLIPTRPPRPPSQSPFPPFVFFFSLPCLEKKRKKNQLMIFVLGGSHHLKCNFDRLLDIQTPLRTQPSLIRFVLLSGSPKERKKKVTHHQTGMANNRLESTRILKSAPALRV